MKPRRWLADGISSMHLRNINWLTCFHAGSVIHALVIVSLVAINLKVVRYGRGKGVDDQKISDKRFATGMFIVCLLVFLRDLRPDRLGWEHSLPLHLCDITGFVAVIALRTRDPIARCILHYWGLILSSQAFLFPVVQSGPIHVDFWLYWVDHGGIIVAAIYDVMVRGYQPTWQTWRMSALLLAAYTLIMTPFDKLMHVNYGFLGETSDAIRSGVTAFGPWPQRIPALWLTAIAAMALLQLLWPISRRSESRRRPLTIDDIASACEGLSLKAATV